MNAAKRKALDAMAAGSPLYVYAESEKGDEWSRPAWRSNWPKVGSGTILSDEGPIAVSSRTVTAIRNLGTYWCAARKALMLTPGACLRARGHYKLPEGTWVPAP